MRRTGCLKSWFISCRAVALAAIFCLISSNTKANVPEINADYLDTLTGAKVTWEEVASAGEYTIAIGDKFYKYTYHMPNGYTETNTRLNDNLTEENTKNKALKAEYTGSGAVKGVAIYNSKIFQNPIIADFIENYAQSTSYKVYGGAVYNNGSMGDITGSFIGNYAYSKGNDTYGGAIYNGGTIGDITGEFIGNYAYSKKEDAEGGAVYNGAGRIIRNITGDFIGNYAFSEESAAYGGAINNTDGSIGDISGNFIGNYTLSLYGASGGAIYSFGGSINYGCDIGDINGNFENNYVVSLKSGAKGGAIDIAMTTIGDITGDFNGNYAYSENSSANGGAINNAGGSIGDITGNFNSNSSLGYLEVAGGAIYNGGTINNITGDFVDNYAGSMGKAFGGAIYNDWDSVLTLVNSSFYNNYAVSPKSGASGGAIFNEGELDIRADNGNSIFSGNYTEAINDDGSTTKKSNAIYSLSKINLNSINQGLIQFDDIITGGSELDKLVLKGLPQEFTSTESEYTFTYFQNEDGDYVITRGSDSIVAKNINNKYAAILYDSWSMSPLDLEYEISNLYAEEEGDYYIGEYTILEPILQEDGNYLVNFYDYYNTAGPALNITGDQSSDVVFNNLVEGFSTIDISGTKVHANKGPFVRSFTHGGGLLNVNAGVVAEDSIVGDGGRVNIATGATAERTEVHSGGSLHVATGGVANDTTVNSGGMLETEVQAKLNNLLAKGGAILDLDAGTVLTGDVIIDANADLQGEYDYDNIFKKESVETGSLTLVGGLNNKLEAEALVNTVEDKSLKLTNGKYNIGDGYQAVSGWDELVIKDNAEVKLEGDVKLANASKNIKLLDGSELNLAGHSPGYYEIVGSLNNDGNINFSHENDRADDVTKLFGNYKAFANAKMTIDIDPDANVSDVLMVEGDVEGTTKLTINPMSGNQASDKILFVSAPNDLNSTPAYFEVFRVIGDAQVWNVLHENNNWYVGTSNVIADADKNGYGDKADLGDLNDDDAFVDAVLPPNFGSGINNANKGNKKPAKKTEVYAEAMAYAAVAGAGLEQTKSVTDSVANNVEATKYFHKICGGYYDCYYDKNPLRSSWVAPAYARAEVNAPVDFEADIWGLEGGFDLQSDVYNRLGVFVSYRQGEYEVSGKGDEIFSKTKSDIDIDSYLAGLYYRYDKGRVYALATLFGGWQDVDISTIDGVKSDTNGWQMGASVESGLMFRQSRTMFVQPFVKLGYNQINYNNARDNYGKKADIGDVKNMDVELGVKFDKKIWFEKDMQARIYLKPSVIQSFGDAEMKVSGVDKVDTLNDKTIAKIDFGGSFDLNNGWSGFADLSHAFGDDYENTSLNVGAKYSW